MTDILQKLRSGGHWVCGRWINFSDGDRHEAADEIERLRSKLDGRELTRKIDELLAELRAEKTSRAALMDDK